MRFNDACLFPYNMRFSNLVQFVLIFLSQPQGVDYKGLSSSEDFKKFVHFTRELHRVDIASATREEKLAFFINIYNSLVIHALVVKGPPTNMFQRWKVSCSEHVGLLNQTFSYKPNRSYIKFHSLIHSKQIISTISLYDLWLD